MNKIIYVIIGLFVCNGCAALVDVLKSPWAIEAETAIVEEVVEEAENVHFRNSAPMEDKKVSPVQEAPTPLHV